MENLWKVYGKFLCLKIYTIKVFFLFFMTHIATIVLCMFIILLTKKKTLYSK